MLAPSLRSPRQAALGPAAALDELTGIDPAELVQRLREQPGGQGSCDSS